MLLAVVLLSPQKGGDEARTIKSKLGMWISKIHAPYASLPREPHVAPSPSDWRNSHQRIPLASINISNPGHVERARFCIDGTGKLIPPSYLSPLSRPSLPVVTATIHSAGPSSSTTPVIPSVSS